MINVLPFGKKVVFIVAALMLAWGQTISYAQTYFTPSNPTCTPGTITPGISNNEFKISINYGRAMQISPSPTVTFTGFSGTEESEVFPNAPQYFWSDGNKKLDIVYVVDPTKRVNRSGITATINPIQSSTPGLWANPAGVTFNVALGQSTGTISFSPQNINISSGSPFTMTVDYSDPMNNEAPDVTFQPDLIASNILQGMMYSWQTNKQCIISYTVTDDGNNHGSIGVTIAATDAGDVPAANATGSFLVDFKKPACTVTADPSSIGPNTTALTITLVYDEEMDVSPPSIAFSNGFNPTPAAGTGWLVNKTTYVAKYTITSSNLNTQSVITVANAKDLAGNIQIQNSDAILTIDQRKPQVKRVTMIPSSINRGISTATLEVEFENADAMATGDIPSIIFAPDMSTVLTGGPSSWNGMVYSREYIINTSNNTTMQPNVAVTVSGAKDNKGTIIDPTTKTNVFSVDMTGVTCRSVVFDPAKLQLGVASMKMTITYEAPMQAVNPTIVFVDAQNNPITDANNNLFNAPSFVWTSTTVCEVTYPLKPNPQLQILDIHARITGAKRASDGSTQVPYLSTSSFMADLKDLGAVVTPSADPVKCTDSELQLRIAFNQIMIPTAENINIADLPDYDYKYDFLQFEKTEWTDNSTAVVTYRVEADKNSTGSVKVWVHNLQNAGGRAFDKEYGNVFSAESNPPTIDNAIYTSPLCHNDATGSINLTVSGGNPGYTYEWSKDGGTPALGTLPNIIDLGPGQYIVKAYGSDRCFASSSGVLNNPDAIILTTEVVQNVVRKDDGIIQMTAEGGTPDYRYYVDGTPYTDGRVENLKVGTYALAVVDANSCTATDQAVIADHRIPTAFTPNEDGYNDMFMEGNRVKIFDRNGTLLHEGDNGWDGKYKGQVMRPAVYFYIVTFPDGSIKKGSVQIFKK